ncbi:MAG: hypothetical protein WCV63_09410 [Negativicutes bacterium]|jgi:hypothetical protein
MEQSTTIVAILQSNRRETSTAVQEVLTKYGCNIRTRLGLHDVSDNYCADTGMILLQMFGDFDTTVMETELNRIHGVKMKYMVMEF